MRTRHTLLVAAGIQRNIFWILVKGRKDDNHLMFHSKFIKLYSDFKDDGEEKEEKE